MLLATRSTLSGGTATFGTKDVGLGKTVTLTGASWPAQMRQLHAGLGRDRRRPTSRAMPITGSFTAGNKVYDGNTSATVLTAA